MGIPEIRGPDAGLEAFLYEIKHFGADIQTHEVEDYTVVKVPFLSDYDLPEDWRHTLRADYALTFILNSGHLIAAREDETAHSSDSSLLLFGAHLSHYWLVRNETGDIIKTNISLVRDSSSLSTIIENNSPLNFYKFLRGSFYLNGETAIPHILARVWGDDTDFSVYSPFVDSKPIRLPEPDRTGYNPDIPLVVRKGDTAYTLEQKGRESRLTIDSPNSVETLVTARSMTLDLPAKVSALVFSELGWLELARPNVLLRYAVTR